MKKGNFNVYAKRYIELLDAPPISATYADFKEFLIHLANITPWFCLENEGQRQVAVFLQNLTGLLGGPDADVIARHDALCGLPQGSELSTVDGGHHQQGHNGEFLQTYIPDNTQLDLLFCVEFDAKRDSLSTELQSTLAAFNPF
jgi:hypothetical protein